MDGRAGRRSLSSPRPTPRVMSADARGFRESSSARSPSHRRFHLNRNLFDKNIPAQRPATADRESEVGSVCLLHPSVPPSSRRINRTACKFGGKSIHPSASVEEGACLFLASSLFTSVQAGGLQRDVELYIVGVIARFSIGKI